MAALATVELDQIAPPVGLVVDKAEQVERLDQLPQLFRRVRQLGRAVLGLPCSDQARRLHSAELERAATAEQILPMLYDGRHV